MKRCLTKKHVAFIVLGSLRAQSIASSSTTISTPKEDDSSLLFFDACAYGKFDVVSTFIQQSPSKWFDYQFHAQLESINFVSTKIKVEFESCMSHLFLSSHSVLYCFSLQIGLSSHRRRRRRISSISIIGMAQAVTEDGESCLHLSSISNSFHVAQLVLGNGADVNLRVTHTNVRKQKPASSNEPWLDVGFDQ